MPRYIVQIERGPRVIIEANTPEEAEAAGDAMAQQSGETALPAIAALTANIGSQAGQQSRQPAPARPQRSPFAAPQGPARLPSPQGMFGQTVVHALSEAGRAGWRASGAETPRARSDNSLVDALMGGPAGIVQSIVNTGAQAMNPDSLGGATQSTINQVTPWVMGAFQGRRPRGEEATQAIQQMEQERRASGNLTPGEWTNLNGAAMNYQPSTYAGGIANRAGQAAPFAAAPGGTLPTLAGFLAGEGARGAGAAAGANEAEQNALGFAGNVVGGVAGLPFTGARPHETILRNATRDITPQDTAMARALMEGAQELPGGGIRLGGDEALAQVAPGRSAPLQGRVRQVSRTEQGARAMGRSNAQRPGQIRSTTEAVADQIAPPIQDPARVGTRAQAAADDALLNLERQRTAQTRPLYEAANPEPVPTEALLRILEDARTRAGADQTGLVRDPLLQAIQGVDPAWDTGNLSRYSRALRDQAEIPFGQPGALNRELAGAQTSLADQMLGLLRGEGDRPTALGEADARYAQISRDVVDPAAAGPLGAIRSNNVARNSDPLRQADALYPASPPEGQPNVTASALQMLDQQSPGVGADLTRLALLNALDQGARRTQGGENLMGGANAANNLTRNRTQGDTFRAGVQQVAPHAADTVDTLIQALQATGTRRNEGSPTATDARGLAEMGAADPPLQAAISGARPWAIPQRFTNWLSDIYTGANADAIMRVLESDPATFEQLMNGLPNAARARRTTGLIKAIIAASAQDEEPNQ